MNNEAFTPFIDARYDINVFCNVYQSIIFYLRRFSWLIFYISYQWFCVSVFLPSLKYWRIVKRYSFQNILEGDPATKRLTYWTATSLGTSSNPSRTITFLYGLIPKWMCPWCNGYRRRKWTRRHDFKSWTRLIAFHIALIPLGKVWIQLFSLQLWVNSSAATGR